MVTFPRHNSIISAFICFHFLFQLGNSTFNSSPFLLPRTISTTTNDHIGRISCNNKHEIILQSLKGSEINKIQSNDINRFNIAFPGGGIFFYWQIGVIQYLRDNNYNLLHTSLAGASAGALSATLTATNVNFFEATELALSLAKREDVWNRALGLQGVWGSLIYEWLDELLPNNSVELVSDRLALLVTPLPFLSKTRVTKFENREDLIRCNMASVHLPWFLDGKFVSNFRNQPHIDGSFLANRNDYFSESKKVIIIDYSMDPVMSAKAKDFVKLTSPEGIYSMIKRGGDYAEIMEDNGEFASLNKLY